MYKFAVCFVAAFVVVVTAAYPTQAQSSVTVRPTGNVWQNIDTYLTPGCITTFIVHVTNESGYPVKGGSNGFRIGVKDNYGYYGNLIGGFQIIDTKVLATDLYSYWDGGLYLTDTNVDGIGWDTVGFGGFSLFQQGIPDGFDEDAFAIRVHTDRAMQGNYLCIDSTWYPPGGAWLWSTNGGNVFPDWAGVQCYGLVIIPCGIYDFYDTGTVVTVGSCDRAEYTFNAYVDINPDNPTNFQIIDGPGEITSDFHDGLWTWEPEESDAGQTYTVTVEAGGCGECATKSITVHVTAPTFGFTKDCGEPVVLAAGDTIVADVGLPNGCFAAALLDDGGAPAGACYLDDYRKLHFESDLSCRGVYNVRVCLIEGLDSLSCTTPVLVTSETCLLRGNVDGDMTDGGAINIADLTRLVDYLFTGGLRPTCMEEGNVDGIGDINVSDLTFLVAYLFQGGAAPPPCP